MDISTVASILQSGLSVVGFLALSFWMMKWAKGLHERNKELGDIDKEIRAALKDSFAVQKELHEIQRKKLEFELDNLTNDVGKKNEALESEQKILRATIKALDVAEAFTHELHKAHIAIEADNADKLFLNVIALLDSNGIIKRSTFFALDSLKPLNDGATLEEEIAWRLTNMHLGGTRISAYAEAITYLTPAAVSFILRNPEASQEKIYDELRRVISETLSQRAKIIRANK
jgi:hypothetical protein